MSIELRVKGRLQQSSMSCWWTAVACVLEYYGRRYGHPAAFAPIFQRPVGRSPTWVGFESPSLDEAMQFDSTLRRMPGGNRLAPYEWYLQGLPNTNWGLRRLCEITGFRGVPDCPAYGQWLAADFERILRAYGPFVFHGYWNNLPHSIVVCGINTADAGGSRVASMDPGAGFVSSTPLTAFNALMTGMNIDEGAFGLNPIHYPTSQPVRAVIATS